MKACLRIPCYCLSVSDCPSKLLWGWRGRRHCDHFAGNPQFSIQRHSPQVRANFSYCYIGVLPAVVDCFLTWQRVQAWEPGPVGLREKDWLVGSSFLQDLFLLCGDVGFLTECALWSSPEGNHRTNYLTVWGGGLLFMKCEEWLLHFWKFLSWNWSASFQGGCRHKRLGQMTLKRLFKYFRMPITLFKRLRQTKPVNPLFPRLIRETLSYFVKQC